MINWEKIGYGDKEFIYLIYEDIFVLIWEEKLIF